MKIRSICVFGLCGGSNNTRHLHAPAYLAIKSINPPVPAISPTIRGQMGGWDIPFLCIRLSMRSIHKTRQGFFRCLMETDVLLYCGSTT